MNLPDQSGPRSPGSSPPSSRISNYLRLNPVRNGVLFVDLENAFGQIANIGIPTLDPAWILDKAKRMFTLKAYVIVANLDKPNPLTGRPIGDYETLKPWSDAGFTIVHAPAKSICEQGSDGLWRHKHFKDQTDSVLRAQMHLWASFMEITDVILTSHDVDFAETARTIRKTAHIVTLTAKKEYLASKLRQAADSRFSALWYNAALSSFLLGQRHWWDQQESLEVKREKVLSWFDGDTGMNGNIRLQLSDMQDILRFLVNNLRMLPPDRVNSVQLTYSELCDQMHGHLVQEKSLARLETPRQQPDHVDILSLEDKELSLPVAQAQSCQVSIRELIESLRAHQVVQHTKEPKHGVTQLFVNDNHPAVQLLMDLDFR